MDAFTASSVRKLCLLIVVLLVPGVHAGQQLIPAKPAKIEAPRGPVDAVVPKAVATPLPSPAVASVAATQKAPTPPMRVVFKPNVLTADISHNWGQSFRLRYGQVPATYLVMSHSLFSKQAGLDIDMTSEDVAKVTVAVVGVACDDRTHLVLARPYIPLEGARVTDKQGTEKDIAIFKVLGGEVTPALAFDPAPPLKGDDVWIYFKVTDKTHMAVQHCKLVAVLANEINFSIDEGTAADFIGAVGAPLIAEDSSVVGMFLGTFTANGKLYGFGCTAAAIKQYIDSSVPKKAPKSLM